MAEDLNEVVEEVVSDALVMTVNIDDTLTVSGEAADAKAVGDALALKADISQLSTAVTVNGQSADAQGHIIVDASEIEMSSSDTTKVKDAIEAAAGRTGADIPVDGMAGADKINTALAQLDAKTADAIKMASNDETTVSVKISAIEIDMVKKSTDIVDDLTTEDSTKALSAKQGVTLSGRVADLSALGKVKQFTNGGSTSIKITKSSTLDAKDLFLIMHRNSDNGLTLVSGGGVVNNLTSASLSASVSGNVITLTGNNLYYANVTVIGGSDFTISN